MNLFVFMEIKLKSGEFSIISFNLLIIKTQHITYVTQAISQESSDLNS